MTGPDLAPRNPVGAPAAARALARTLLDGEGQTHGSLHDSVGALERATVRVRDGLSRWFGAFGSQTILSRSLAAARRQHAVLADVTIGVPTVLEGLEAAVKVHGGPAAEEAVIATIVALAALLGRLLGDDLAISLLEQCVTSPEGSSDSPGAFYPAGPPAVDPAASPRHD